MREIRPIARQRVADEIYQAIRRAILERTFVPGERLDIPSLAGKFDVSPMPVRQAISRLATVGLVEVKPRSGTFVARLSEREVRNTFDIRRALECLAAETAASNWAPDDLLELQGIVSEIDSLANDAGARERHDELNNRFHRTIVRLSGNEKLLQMYEDLNAHLKIARIHSERGDWTSRIQQENAEHREILAALKRRDSSALASALRRHIERSKNALTRDLAAAGVAHPNGGAE